MAEARRLYDAPDVYAAMLARAAEDGALLAELERVPDALRRDGYAVVRGVVTDDFADAIHDQLWDVLEASTAARLPPSQPLTRPVAPGDLELCGFVKSRDWTPNKHGILEDGRIAYLPCVHEVRTYPRVAFCFSRLYGCAVEQLVVAPDRINYQLPYAWLPRQPPLPAQGSWLHIDQSVDKHGRYCVQGYVTLTDATRPDDGTLECLRGSHLWHDDLETMLGRKLDGAARRSDWLMFTPEDKARFEPGRFTRVVAPKGSLVLWDSRLIHQGGLTIGPRPRFVIYTCMQPRFSWSAQQQAVKQQAFAQRRATAHWPLTHLKGSIFGAIRTYGRTLPVFDLDPHLAPLPAPGSLLERFYGLGPLPVNIKPPTRPALLDDFAPEAGVVKDDVDDAPLPVLPRKRARVTREDGGDGV